MKLTNCVNTSSPPLFLEERERENPSIPIEIQPTCGCVPAYLGKKVKLS